jgi:hypothetical protein
MHGDEPLLAIGTPGGDNQEQTILQALLNVLEFKDGWYPNLRIQGRLVSESACGDRVAAGADAAFLPVILAA